MYAESYEIINISFDSDDEVGDSEVKDNITYKSDEFIDIDVILA
jgi:hypothetical protein